MELQVEVLIVDRKEQQLRLTTQVQEGQAVMTRTIGLQVQTEAQTIALLTRLRLEHHLTVLIILIKVLLTQGLVLVVDHTIQEIEVIQIQIRILEIIAHLVQEVHTLLLAIHQVQVAVLLAAVALHLRVAVAAEVDLLEDQDNTYLKNI